MLKKIAALAACCALLAAAPCSASMQITEWMYQGVGGSNFEFVEFTNMGSSPVDFDGWSFDDNSQAPGSFSLSAFGVVMPSESVVLTEAAANSFRTRWNLAPSVKIVGGLSHNLGRNDEINLYDAATALIDQLTYDDATGKGPRTQGASCTVPVTDLALQVASGSWVLATNGDMYGSWTNSAGEIGNPGFYYGVIPEPGSVAALSCALAALWGLTRRRK